MEPLHRPTPALSAVLGGRRYRITGRDWCGLVTAEHERDGQWREVRYGLRLAQLTVLADGTLPEGYPDSDTRAKLLPKLRRQVEELNGRLLR